MACADLDDPELTLEQIFRCWPASVGLFLDRRMHCVGCPIAPFHTVRDACREHGIGEREFRKRLRAAAEGGTRR